MFAVLNHVRPFQVSTCPVPSTTMQKEGDGHDTESRRLVPRVLRPRPVMLAGLDQVLPSQLRALPEPSTAMQKEGDGHDTELIQLLPSMFVGLDQPFELSALPPFPAAMQKVVLEHDARPTTYPWSASAP